MNHPEGITPISDTAWEQADARIELADGTRTAIWMPGNLAAHGVAQSERPTDSGLVSRDAVHNNLLICARVVHLAPTGALLGQLGIQAWSAMQDGAQLARMHYSSGEQLKSTISSLNRNLPPEHTIMNVAPQPGGFFPAEIMANCIAEDDSVLPISAEDPELTVHDTALHVTAWMALSRTARLAGRGHARDVLAGNIPLDSNIPKAGDTPVRQLARRLDNHLNSLLINEESLVPPKYGGRFASRGASMLITAFTNGFGADYAQAEQLRQDTWSQAAYLQQVFGGSK